MSLGLRLLLLRFLLLLIEKSLWLVGAVTATHSLMKLLFVEVVLDANAQTLGVPLVEGLLSSDPSAVPPLEALFTSGSGNSWLLIRRRRVHPLGRDELPLNFISGIKLSIREFFVYN